MIDDGLYELAARYRLRKTENTLTYALEYASAEGGRIRRRTFDYVPETHYRQAFEEYRDRMSDR